MSSWLDNRGVLLMPDVEFTIYRELRDKLGLDHAAVCGIMANICAESGFRSVIVEDAFAEKSDCSSSEYTEKVDTGQVSPDEFAHDGAGYGLCQWTLWSRKEKLHRFVRGRGCSIGDLHGQIDFLVCELKTDFPDVLDGLANKRKGHCASIEGETFAIETRDTLQRAYDAAFLFCAVFEQPYEATPFEQCRERGRLAEVLFARYMEPFASRFADGIQKPDFVSESIEDVYVRNIARKDYSFIEEISPCMRSTVVSLEDDDFRRHHGVDYLRTMVALAESAIYRVRMGGSTITQQLARNLYLTPERTVSRKLREMRQARYIEKRLSKDQILELYLNIVYYGSGACGITSASEVYFDCKPSELEAYQCVALCVTLPAPSIFNPFADGELFLTRAECAHSVLLKHGDADPAGIDELRKAEREYIGRIRESAAKRRNDAKRNFRELAMSKGLSVWNSYEGKLDRCIELGGDTPETFQRYRIDCNNSLKGKMRLCSYPSPTGEKYQFHHLFFHSLVLEPEKAFGRVDGCEDFESWFVTLDEFKGMLNALHDRGYVLVDMRKLLAGQVQLPAGKTPLVLSFDDMNYYDYMRGCGFASRMIVDAQGDISYLKEESGRLVEVKYGDSVTVLEEFISEHPDFSHGGARGIIGLTGYEGLFGYRDLADPALAAVVHKLKSMGWDMACHSFGHDSRIYNNEIPNAPEGIADVEEWLDGPGRVLGETDIFISPFGADIRNNPQLLEHLKRRGFVYFCGVADRRSVETDGESFYVQRYSVDGVMMRERQCDFDLHYGDLSSICDAKRTRPLQPPAMDAISLVRHAYACMRVPSVYFMDGMGQVLTRERMAAARKEHPEYYDDDYFDMLWHVPNGEIRGFDCSGMIKSFLMGGLSRFSYDGSKDINADTMFRRAAVKGDIATMPEQRGICVHMTGHVGVYVGRGRVIEATPNLRFGNGVVMTMRDDREWTHWFQLDGISYEPMG